MPHSLNGAYSDGDSEVSWEDGERVFRRGWRLDDSGERRPVLIVLPAADHPSRSSLDHLIHEHELRDELDEAWAVRPLDLVRKAGRTMLVLEDAGGEPLERLLGAPMEVGRFLRLAVGIGVALGKMHQRGLVHKNIKPANVLVNEATGEVRLTGFGIASRVARERQSPRPPETIAGTLAYMAPEQTGRMNRSIDSRSDLYALGVTFYRLLTGALPFTTADPMEWVHCHLARQPVAPAERLKEIPGAVSAIVMKLLAKRAEERYQTATGLERDLRRCRAEWAAQGWIDDFPLGEHDTSDRLLIPERLYGRRREVEALLASFDRVIKGGAPELVLVSGYSGIGKSAVVNELQPVLVPPRGLFASGKFDQYKRDIPYSTLAQAFASLIRPLLGKSEADLAPWRDALGETLGPNARLIADLVPEVKLIIGEPPPVPELPPQDAQRRFQLVFQHFIGVFARPEHPLALFLDDLQWLDAATLDLLEDLLSRSDLRNFLLIGAYRDNEVTPAHPLLRKLEAIRASGRVQDIKLGPLTAEDLGGLVADSLRCEAEQAAPLAGLVHAKTDGNPFFVIQFLHALADEGLLAFDHARARWSYDLGGINAKGYTDNVAELLAEKLARLPLETQDAVRQLACLGNVAGVAMLSIVLGTPEEQVLADLWEALRQQLIERTERSYKFIHDRVQEAAYALIPEESRAAAHLTIGRLLVAQTPLEKREEAIFEIVNQLNRGAPLITSQDEREQLAELNLAAGMRAKASSAYASALTYLTVGATLLPEDAWERRQELAFAFELHSATCEVCTGALQAAEERLTALATRAVGTVQRCAVAQRRADLYTMLGAGDRAVAVALECLRHLGIDWSPHPTEVETRGEYERFWSRLGTRAIEDIVDLPLMRDPEALATLDVLSSLIVPALYTDLNLSALSICRAANLNLERGNSDGAPANYVALGIIASARFGHYDQGYRFGKMGCDLLERRGLNHFGGRTYTLFAVLVPWTRPLGEAIDPARRAFQMAKEHGDPAFAALAIRDLCFNLLALGHPLDQIEREAEQGLEFVRRFGSFLDRVSAPLALVRTLRGRTTKFGSLDDGRFTERSFEERMADQPGPSFVECYYWIRKLQARFFAGDYMSAIDAAEKAETWYATSASLSLIMLQETEYHFYAALSRAAWCATTGPDSFATHREALGKHERQLRAWAANCPQNFEARAALVSAEIARIEGRPLDAMNLYERAIVSARANGFVHNEALAYELAARFYAAHGFEEVAHLYVGNARRGYLRWGADGKVRQLDRLHSRLRQDERAPGPTGIIQAPIEQLDVATVIRVSQAVSSEMVLEKLIDRLMRTAIEYAGAERGLLIIPRSEELQIEAEAITHGEDVIVHLQDGAHAAALPESIVRYSMRTQESVILDDASSQNPFSAETYIVQRRARSILCLPLINQARLIGILYLENNLTSHVFTRDRVMILKVLASQAAISLQNSRLYRDLANRERKIQRLVDANILGICIWNLDGAVVEANEAFLRMLQYGRDDVVSGRLRWTDLTPAEWRELDERAVAELRSTGTFQPVEKEYFRKDGSRLPVLIGGALFEENGSEGVAFVLDLTERKRAEDALRESEAQRAEARRELRQLIDTIRTPVVSYSADNRRDFVNAAWKQYTGLSDEAALGTEWSVVTHPDHIATGEEMWLAALATGKPWHTEERVQRADGQYRWFAIDRVAARDENGKIIKWYATGYDIDDRKRAEERLHVQHTVAQILAEAARIEEATPRILLAIGECLGWDVGVLWRVDREAKALRCVELWHTASIEVPEFERVSRESTFGPGLGLPGRVWSSLEPEYIPNVVPDENFPRAPTAELEGLRTAFGFPILLGGQALGVIEFFSREIRQPDHELLNVLATIGSQIGQFIERKRAEQALREREAKIRRLVDANIVGIFIWDFDGRILEANEAFLHIVGYDHEDLVAGRLRWTDLTPPEWRHRDAQLVQEHKVAGTLQPFEKEYFQKDGSRVPVLIGVATFEGSENQGVAFVIDLTERKRAEEALRRGEAWLAQAQRLSHTGTWVMNGTTRRFLYWSDECYRIWGLDPLQGLPSREDMWGRIHPDDRERVWVEVQEAMREQRDFFAEFRILLPDGTVRYLEANSRHEFSPLGALLEVICTSVDVTERKRAQEEREKLRQLESDIAHMNRVSMMGELAVSLAHEIAQPIATARNNARAAMHFLSRSPIEPGDVKEALACVVDDADRAAEILDRIRDQIKKAPPRKDHFDLGVAINEVMVLAREVVIRNGVSVQSRLADGLFSVQGDRVQLQQVLLNLILNAVEAMGSVEAGPRELLISAEQDPAGVRFAVRDSGPGIDPAHLERVFDAFYTTKPSGVGMGLSICRSIIESHGGRLWVELNAPRGTVFHFNLPSTQTCRD